MTPEEKRVLKFKKMVIKELKKNHFKLHNRKNISEYVINYEDPNNKYSDYKNNGVVKDIADKMEASGEFNKEIVGVDEYWVVTNVIKGWTERNPFGDKVRTGLITFLFSIGAAILLYYILPPRPSPDSIQQNQHLIRLSDSLKILDTKTKVLENILTKHK